MRKRLLLLPCLLLLCGFGIAPYDADAVPRAQAARQQALGACNARTDFKSTSEVIDCVVAADRDFARMVRLRDPKLLDDYAGKVKLLDADIGTGAVKPVEIPARFRALQTAFFKAVKDAYTSYQAEAAEDFTSQSREGGSNMPMQSGGMDSMNGMGMGGM